MFKLVVVGTIAAFASAYHPVNKDIVEEIRQKASWKPMDPTTNPFSKKSYDEIKGLLGTVITKVDAADYLSPTILEAVPAAYDARTTGCVHEIRDQ